MDCTFGEILVTLEKAKWLCQEGESCLLPERRTPGAVIASKECRVEYHPVGVFGVIAPWNYREPRARASQRPPSPGIVAPGPAMRVQPLVAAPFPIALLHAQPSTTCTTTS